MGGPYLQMQQVVAEQVNRFMGGPWLFIPLAVLYGLLFAVSAVRLERRPPARWWRWVPTGLTAVVAALVAVPLALPVFPQSWVTTEQFVASGSLGRPELTRTVADVHRTQTVLYAGKDTSVDDLREHFTDVRLAAATKLDAQPNNINQNVKVYVCSGPRQPWPKLWTSLRRW